MAPYPYTEPSGVALYYIRGHFTSRALRSKQLSECPRLQLGGERVGIQIQFWCLKFLIILGPIFLLERGRQIKVEVEIQSGEGNGTLLQCSCLENPRDGGAWWVETSTGSWKKQESSRKNVYLCFIDYAKAFDYVDHNKSGKFLEITLLASW